MEVLTMFKSEYGKTIILNNWRGIQIIETVAGARRNEITDLVDRFACTVDPRYFVLFGMKRSVHEIFKARNIEGTTF